jgi:broad specificity phosphatase PhoE
MTTIILCRHGESEGNRERRFGGHGPTPLSERGREQARKTGRRLAAEGIDAVYSSDLPRAVETAALIGEAVGCEATLTPRLRERSVGALTGLTFEEAQARFPEAYAELLRSDFHACPPGGESYADCSARTIALLDDLVEREAGRRVLLVTHALTLYYLIRRILGLADPPAAPLVFFQIDNCALHRFQRLEEGIWKVVGIGDRSHLLGP